MAKGFTNEDAEEFLDKVKDLEKQVKGIIDGSISIEEVDEKIATQEKVKEYRENQKKQEEEKKLIHGRKGKGHKAQYKRFCSF
jgi:hypothetical protein